MLGCVSAPWEVLDCQVLTAHDAVGLRPVAIDLAKIK